MKMDAKYNYFMKNTQFLISTGVCHAIVAIIFDISPALRLTFTIGLGTQH